MPHEIDDQALLAMLRRGVERSSDLIARITDYHGGPVTTEYVLTSDIARELIEGNYEVEVEYLNRRMVNGMTMRRSGAPVTKFGSRRTDIAVVRDGVIPLAVIEVKIGVKTLQGVADDLRKITGTIGALKSQYASRVRGAVVLQVHVAGSSKRYGKEHFKAAIGKIETTLRAALQTHAQGHVDFRFSLNPLQDVDAGIVERELENGGDGLAWGGRHGHATRFYAVLIQSRQRTPAPPRTIDELKARQ